MRSAVFIDGAYLNKILANFYGSVAIKYDVLAHELVPGGDILRSYYYDAPPYQSSQPTQDESKRFASRLLAQFRILEQGERWQR